MHANRGKKVPTIAISTCLDITCEWPLMKVSQKSGTGHYFGTSQMEMELNVLY